MRGGPCACSTQRDADDIFSDFATRREIFSVALRDPRVFSVLKNPRPVTRSTVEWRDAGRLYNDRGQHVLPIRLGGFDLGPGGRQEMRQAAGCGIISVGRISLRPRGSARDVPPSRAISQTIARAVSKVDSV